MRMMLDIDRATSGATTFDGQRFSKLDAPLRMVGAMLDANAVEPKRSARSHLRYLRVELCRAMPDLAIDARQRRRIIPTDHQEKPMPPSATDHRTFTASLEEVRAAASDALSSLGANVEVSEDGTTLSAKTGWSLLSFGQRIEVQLRPDADSVDVGVTSTQNRFQVADLGKMNQKNVGTILSTMETRLHT